MVAILGFAAFSGGSDSGSASSDSIGANPGAVDVSLTVPPSVTAIAVDTLPEVQKSTIAAPVTFGAVGSDVEKVQARLKELGFDPGPVDGVFGETTRQAVWAYKKLILRITPAELQASDNASMITPDMWSAMQDDISI
ncbi:MAG TPA: hypothetical protein DCR14_02550, partial [Acidimicrobiaceae bacterium]|nr:hypothetical protein [Acidimicrobiaceae bacterium]